MNKAQIKAELRRSACEDKHPAYDERTPLEIGCGTWYDIFVRKDGVYLYQLSDDDCRTFFLLVAEAL